MNQEEFIKKLSVINKKFAEEVSKPLVELVKEAETSDFLSWYNICGKEEVSKLDDMALLVAWVQDTLSGDKAKHTKKMRKALGYLIP